ncbi:glycoside hydrolase family 26 protein [Arthrobacter burdickii]|uniref:Glycosyl hydrolase n=1 Tax=Arthrobacter burdickii TaxID=3035920 RepID=A0ABT8K539_9MICC|nr:glycosyl hydrolase [Arthrobacter burdickii]MDN4612561.1 glycosyl hydrolase [Arthrobacter burdickii]
MPATGRTPGIRRAVLVLAAALIACLAVVLFLPGQQDRQEGRQESGSEDGQTSGRQGGQEGACGNADGGPTAVGALPAPSGPGLAGLPAISGKRPAFGIATEGGFGLPGQWDEVAIALGESPSLIMAYSNFTEPVPWAGLEAVAARGATPVVTWEPWDPATGPDQTRFALSTITAGHHDAYLQQWAGALRAYGKPVLLRFAHEMNSPWYPWGADTNGNAPADYVDAWRHVHDLFADAGATNVSWVWNPEAPACDSLPLKAFYPGDGYVDVVALDAYNWGTTRENEAWRSARELFAEGLRQLREVAPGIPIVIGETASTESGGSKAEWAEGLVAYLAAQPDVQAFIWFDYRKESDWRIDSSDASRDALRSALSAR